MNGRVFIEAGVCLAVGVLYALTATWLLGHGNLHEDAYILFQYSHHLAGGWGIVFDRLSGPAEGATDFLWMVALALVSGLGVELGTAAALLNAAGLASIAYVIIRINGGLDRVSGLGIALIALSGGTAASLGGFSALAYGAVFAVFLLGLLERRLLLMATFGVLLALFRPDGALLVLGGLVAALVTAPAEDRKRILLLVLPMGLVGIGYFLWRLDYFGLWLPLPLLVKSQTTSVLEGLGPNLGALDRYVPLLLPFGYLCLRKRLGDLPLRALLIVSLGPLLLFLALAFAHQSQNVGNRLQFPIVVGMVFFFLVTMRHLGAAPAVVRGVLLILPLVVALAGARTITRELEDLSRDEYINAFPQLLRATGFDVRNIALTEAGRFPYWFSADQMTDLVGLNSPLVVLEGPEAVLSSVRPDFVFVHHARRYDTGGLAPGRDFLVVDAQDVPIAVGDRDQSPVKVAPEAALRYAADRDFAAIFVRYDGDYKHVYLLSKELDIEQFLKTLESSMTTGMSYYESERAKHLLESARR